MFRNNINTHLQYHLAQTTQSCVYKNAPNCDVENSMIFCAEHRTDSLRNYGGKKWKRMIKDAAIRGLSALSVSCTIRRDAPVARHISVLYLLTSSWSLQHTRHNSATECGTQISSRSSCKKTSTRGKGKGVTGDPRNWLPTRHKGE